MIHEIGVELGKYLAKNGCPLPVVDGPEATKPAASYGPERVVIAHDDGTDSFGPARVAIVNGVNVRRARNASYKVTIYVRAAQAGVGPVQFEHRRRVEAMLDVVLVGLEYVAVQRGNRFDPKSGQLVIPPDLAASEIPNGAAYELKFTFERAVMVRSFQGAPPPTGTFTGVTSTTNVSTNNEPPGPPETACGG